VDVSHIIRCAMTKTKHIFTCVPFVVLLYFVFAAPKNVPIYNTLILVDQSINLYLSRTQFGPSFDFEYS